MNITYIHLIKYITIYVNKYMNTSQCTTTLLLWDKPITISTKFINSTCLIKFCEKSKDICILFHIIQERDITFFS